MPTVKAETETERVSATNQCQHLEDNLVRVKVFKWRHATLNLVRLEVRSHSIIMRDTLCGKSGVMGGGYGGVSFSILNDRKRA